MTNGEKYLTVEARTEAFKRYCSSHTFCGSCKFKNFNALYDKCAFLWLDANAEPSIADIIATMRRRMWTERAKAGFSEEGWKALCDDLDAAWKRERLLSKSPENDNSGSAIYTAGNNAALREALANLVDVIDRYDSGSPLWWYCGAKGVKPLKDAKAALAAPPRNCDRFNSGDPVKDAEDAYAEWQRWCDAADMPPSCKVESAFRQWLFATAKPNAKGATDGK